MTRAFHSDHGRDHGPHGHDPTPPGMWNYATPLTPAPTPDDYDADSPGNAAFQNGWLNTLLSDGTSYSPLKWRLLGHGKAQMVGAIDGGALGTVCVTLPSEFRPSEEEVTDVVSSVDGTRSMTVRIDGSTGDVTVVGVTQNSVITEAQLTLSDVTTGNVTSTKHGFAPKSPADATKFLNGATTPDYAQVKDSDLSTSDVTTNNASTSKHGFLKKLDNNAAHFMDGQGNWSTPSGGGSVATDTIWDAKGDLAVGTGADTASKQTVGSNTTVLKADSAQSTGVKWEAVKDSELSLTDITTNNASTSAHGFLKKLDNNSAHYMDGSGNWSTPSGTGITEYDYVENTSGLTVTPTSDATAATLITGNSVAYDGSTRILIEFYAVYGSITPNQALLFNLYDGSTDIGRIATIQAISASAAGGNHLGTIKGERFLTPSNASHAYHIKAWKTGGTASIGAGAGGTATYMPAFMRIIKA